MASSKESPKDRLLKSELLQRQRLEKLQSLVNAAMRSLVERRPEFKGKSTEEIRRITAMLVQEKSFGRNKRH
jgi:hypothetical protein